MVVSVDVILAAVLPRFIKWLDSESKTDMTKVGEGGRGAGATCPTSAPATPRDRNIWEDVLSAVSFREARSLMRVE